MLSIDNARKQPVWQPFALPRFLSSSGAGMPQV